MAPKKKKWTDEERAALVTKMNEDLEAFVLDKIKNSDYTPAPYDFEKTMAEMDNHPAFMKEFDPTKPIPPELQAMIDLKYDVEDAKEKAIQYKEDGNQNFKISKYHWAIENYDVSIKCKCADKLLNAQVYTNRAAANFRLANYKSAFTDCLFARKFVPDHMKAIIRGAHALFKMRKYDDALKWIESGLLMEPEHEELLQLRAESEKEKKTQDRDKRKEQAKEKKALAKKKALYDAIKMRGVKLRGVLGEEHDEEDDVGDEFESLFGRTANSEAANARVFIDDFGTLHWPLLFLYPEHGQTDMVSQGNENTRMCDFLQEMFGPETPAPDWDSENKYKPDQIQVYFEDRATESLYAVDSEISMKALLSHKKYTVYGGLPTVIILIKGSRFASDFLQRYSVH